MKTCEFCNKRFDPIKAQEDFESEFIPFYYYSKLKKCLCGSCAIKVINESIDGIYYETCEFCGKKFDVITEQADFKGNFTDWSSASLLDCWKDYGTCCSDCALAKIEESEGGI